MNNILQVVPAYILASIVGILVIILIFMIMKSLSEGREVSFWPPKIGPRNEKTIKDQIPGSFYPVTKVPFAVVPVRIIALLYIFSGESTGKIFFITVNHKSITFGRDNDCDIVIKDQGFSRHHFRLVVSLVRKNNKTVYQIELIDSGSHNGTSIDGNIISRKILEDQECINIGLTAIKIFKLNT